MLDAENRVQQYDQATIKAAASIIDKHIARTIYASDAARLRHAKADILKLGRAAEENNHG